MLVRTSVTERLGIRHPILLAPMDLVSDARLAAAVSAAGGFGLLGAGYGDAQWLGRELALIKTTEQSFGVGFITWSLAKRPELLDLALEAGPRAVMLSFGDPTPFVEAIKRAGALVVCQVQSVKLARQAAEAGADLLVAQGTEGGGHGASRGVMSLVPEIVDAVGPMLPVIAAGGIADGRGMGAALMLGASAVLVGTRFYATEEAAGFVQAKERICAASGDDTLRSVVFDISRRNVWPAPFTGRCLRNRHLDRWYGREIELLREQDSAATQYALARTAGDFDTAAVIAGESVGIIREISTAREVVDGMMRTTLSLLSGSVPHVEVVTG